MAYVPVDVFVLDTTPQQLPVAGAIVRVFSQDGTMIFSQVETDSNGHAGFLLPDSTTFQFRFYKFQVSFTNPQYVVVQPLPVPPAPANPTINSFNIAASLMPPPVSQDPRLCVAFGHFRNGDGSPQAAQVIHFIPKFKPLLVDGNAIMPEQIYEKTDCNGYLEVNLFKCGKYDVTVAGLEDYTVEISVPDLVNVNLPDLLFPVVQSIVFSPAPAAPPAPPYTISVGQMLQLTPTVYLSDGNKDWKGQYDVVWSSDNPAIMGLQVAGGVLTLTGNYAGTANIVARRAHHKIVRIPDSPIVGVPINVTVQ
jgi:hypothetical protein